MSTSDREFMVCADAAAVSRAGAEMLIEMAEAARAEGRRLSVALSGGSTPKTMFEMLASDEYSGRVAWDSIDWFWGDERCVPPDHDDSNFKMTRLAMLDSAPIPDSSIYRISGEKDPIAAADEYESTLVDYFGLSEGEMPRFDLVYLGMGDDGHTASLFPGTKALADVGRIVTHNFVDKFGVYRVTLTASALNNGRVIAFLLAGGGKADRLKEVVEGPPEPDRLPSQMIRATDGRLVMIVDEAAAANLESIQ